MAYSQPVIERGSTRSGRWLRERRLRLALWVAVVEGLLVALTPDLTKWTVLIIGTILLAFYIVAGRNIRCGPSCPGCPPGRQPDGRRLAGRSTAGASAGGLAGISCSTVGVWVSRFLNFE